MGATDSSHPNVLKKIKMLKEEGILIFLYFI